MIHFLSLLASLAFGAATPTPAIGTDDAYPVDFGVSNINRVNELWGAGTPRPVFLVEGTPFTSTFSPTTTPTATETATVTTTATATRTATTSPTFTVLPVAVTVQPTPNPANDISVTGTVTTSGGSNVALALHGCGSASISISGTWTGTLSFQQTNDGSNWFSAWPLPNLGADQTPYDEAAANGWWTIGTAGLTQIRVLGPTDTGTASVTIVASASTQQVNLGNVGTTSVNEEPRLRVVAPDGVSISGPVFVSGDGTFRTPVPFSTIAAVPIRLAQATTTPAGHNVAVNQTPIACVTLVAGLRSVEVCNNGNVKIYRSPDSSVTPAVPITPGGCNYVDLEADGDKQMYLFTTSSTANAYVIEHVYP